MKKLLVILMAMAVMLGIVACGNGDEATAEPVGDRKFVIGISGQGPTNDWATSMLAHLEYALDVEFADKVENYYIAHSDFDANVQINDIEGLMARDIDALLIQPVSEAALVNSVERATEQGIPVIIYGGNVLTDEYVTYVDRNNVEAGEIYAQWMADRIGGEGDVLVIMGFPGSGYSEDVLRGVDRVLNEYEGINVVATEYAYYTPATSKEIVQTYIARGDQLAGVICDGGLMAYGVIEAYTDAGLPIPPLTVDDWNGFMKRAAAENFDDFIVINSGNELMYDAVKAVIDTLEGTPPPKDSRMSPTAMEGSEIFDMIPEDMPDRYWAMTRIPDEYLNEYYRN